MAKKKDIRQENKAKLTFMKIASPFGTFSNMSPPTCSHVLPLPKPPFKISLLNTFKLYLSILSD